MRAGILHAITKIAQKISNQSSLTSLYRSVELNPESVRCCSEFGNIELKTDPFGLTTACLLDTQAVIAAASTLPPESEITFTEKTNKLAWVCGDAKGSWNIVQSDHRIPTIDHANFPWTPPPTLRDALQLAASACQAQAVSLGLYGITAEPDGEVLQIISSNSVALASVKIEKGSYPAGKITMRPPVPDVIGYLVDACPNCVLDITTDGIYIKGDWLAAHLPLGIALQHDLKEYASKFGEMKHTAKVDAGAVRRFIARARGLSDRNSSFTIGLSVQEGKLSLLHNGIAASTEEFFLAEGLDTSINFASVALPADMIVVALPHVETVVFDYLGNSELVLRGTNPEFLYVVGGGEQ